MGKVCEYCVPFFLFIKKMWADQKGYEATNNSKWESLSKTTGFISLTQGEKKGGKKKEALVPKGNETILHVFALLFS